MVIQEKYCDYISVYTNYSGDGNYVAYATIFPMSLPYSASIFTASFCQASPGRLAVLL